MFYQEEENQSHGNDSSDDNISNISSADGSSIIRYAFGDLTYEDDDNHFEEEIIFESDEEEDEDYTDDDYRDDDLMCLVELEKNDKKEGNYNGKEDAVFFADEYKEEYSDGRRKSISCCNFGSILDLDCGSMTVRALIGLGIAGLGGTLVADIFGMFYVDTFLRAYRLPLKVFGIGSAIFAFVHTANDVAGAYLLDWYTARSPTNKREDLVGWSGCLFALSFLAPFFRWGPRPNASTIDIVGIAGSGSGSSTSTSKGFFWDGLHFVGSLSLYDTMFSFNCILQGSIVTDNHSMNENQRIKFYALRDMVGILAPLVVTKVGLSYFDVSNLRPFRLYIVTLAMVSMLLCMWGQLLINKGSSDNGSSRRQQKIRKTRRRQRRRKFLSKIVRKVKRNRRKKKNQRQSYSKIDLHPNAVEDNYSFAPTNFLAQQKQNQQHLGHDSDHTTGLNDSGNTQHHDMSGDSVHSNCSSSNSNDRANDTTDTTNNDTSNQLGFWRIVKDFASHPNFRYWIGMEMLMEGQNTFLGNFQKTFVDQLLRNESDPDETDGITGWSNSNCDWMLALLDPCTQIVGLLLFLPIQKHGYPILYKVVFVSNIVLASGLLLSNGVSNESQKTLPIAFFLFSSIVLSNAMAGAGFGLAMSDMVLEMKHNHSVIQHRINPPSLAGLFMGVNALFCKPAESILPIIAASFLGKTSEQNDETGEESLASYSPESKVVLYRLLVFPPLVCAMLQLLVWSRYSLNTKTTDKLRNELNNYEQAQREQKQREDRLLEDCEQQQNQSQIERDSEKDKRQSVSDLADALTEQLRNNLRNMEEGGAAAASKQDVSFLADALSEQLLDEVKDYEERCTTAHEVVPPPQNPLERAIEKGNRLRIPGSSSEEGCVPRAIEGMEQQQKNVSDLSPKLDSVARAIEGIAKLNRTKKNSLNIPDWSPEMMLTEAELAECIQDAVLT